MQLFVCGLYFHLQLQGELTLKGFLESPEFAAVSMALFAPTKLLIHYALYFQA